MNFSGCISLMSWFASSRDWIQSPAWVLKLKFLTSHLSLHNRWPPVSLSVCPSVSDSDATFRADVTQLNQPLVWSPVFFRPFSFFLFLFFLFCNYVASIHVPFGAKTKQTMPAATCKSAYLKVPFNTAIRAGECCEGVLFWWCQSVLCQDFHLPLLLASNRPFKCVRDRAR